MLFRKNIDPYCAYCKYGSKLNDEEIACTKKGVVHVEDHCRKFSYDPLKRVPPRPMSLTNQKFQKEDFEI